MSHWEFFLYFPEGKDLEDSGPGTFSSGTALGRLTE